MRQKIASIPHWLRLPAVCILCNHYHKELQAICQSCNDLLIPIKQGCDICRLPLVDTKFLQCGYCIKQKPAFDKVYCHYCFEEPLRTLLHEYKYQKRLYLRSLMVKLMVDALPQNPSLGCLVPTPLHPARLRERGFNQAAELTKLLAQTLQLSYDLNLCKKKVNTPAQASLDRKQRSKNLRKAFTSKFTDYSHITLIDDLITTGSTAHELAKILKQQGVKKVDVWCLARTPHPG